MKKVFLLLAAGTVLLTGCAKENIEEDSKVETNEVEETKSGLQEDGTYKFTRNGHDYHLEVVDATEDVVSGATAPKKDDVGDPKYGETFTGEEKEKRMYWSGGPYKDAVVGDYYYDELNFDDGYIASADLIVKDGKIEYLFLDEDAPGDYYASDWGGKPKRLSGYAGFQAESERTDATLVTLVNSMEIIEDQVVNENRLDGVFYSVKGSSNSVNNGFLPLLKAMSEKIKTPSELAYYGVSQDLGDGLFGELVVIENKETQEIVEVRYNEFFADNKEDIKDEDLKQFYRQSKLDSPKYNEQDPAFSQNVGMMLNQIMQDQTLGIQIEDQALANNYNKLVEAMRDIFR